MTCRTRAIVKGLWQSLDLPDHLVENYLHVKGDPSRTLASSFNLGLAAQASISASGLAAAYFNALNGGNDFQDVTVDAQHAALEFRSEAYYSIEGMAAGGLWDALSGLYPTKDSFVRIHTNFPHHKLGILSILGLGPGASRKEMADSLVHWNSREFEDEAAKNGMCATAFRSYEEWRQHAHGQAGADTAPVELIKLGEAPRRSPGNLSSLKGALQGVRILDLTRVIAGPVCGRTLAAHGADTLWITSPNLPSLPNLDPDTSRGKRSAQLDLTFVHDRQVLTSLAEVGDVFLQSYRPGGLEEKGFGPKALSELNPGIICASLCAWGWEGPWSNRRGFDSLVQTATGFNFDEAVAYATFKEGDSQTITPRPFPAQALDHAAGYLLTFGTIAALCKTITEGGSWEVRVSLASVGNWIRSLGKLGPTGFANVLPSLDDPECKQFLEVLSVREDEDTATSDLVSKSTSPPKKMVAVKHSAILKRTSVLEKTALIKLGIDPPAWLPRPS